MTVHRWAIHQGGHDGTVGVFITIFIDSLFDSASFPFLVVVDNTAFIRGIWLQYCLAAIYFYISMAEEYNCYSMYLSTRCERCVSEITSGIRCILGHTFGCLRRCSQMCLMPSFSSFDIAHTDLCLSKGTLQ